MARLTSSGFELNSTASTVEFQTSTGIGTIQTGTVRSGTYAGQITSLVSATAKGFIQQFASSNSNGPYFLRTYFNFATLPSAENRIIGLISGTSLAASYDANITIDNLGKLRLYYNNATVNTLIGSPSVALSTGQWYCIELKFDRSPASGSQVVEARIDQATPFATASNLTINAGVQSYVVGGNLASEAQTTGNWFIDDLALNDSVGSFQNSYPSSGKIIHIHPNASGDANGFTTQTGGTAGSANNFSRVSEVTPNDASTFNGDNTVNHQDLFKCGSSGIGANDVVNVVQVGVRFRNNIADAATAIKLEIEKTSAGTIQQSSAFLSNGTPWNTNRSSVPRNYQLNAYQNPDNVNWTQTTINSMQIGYIISTGGTNRIDVSTVWALIDYTPPTIKTITGLSRMQEIVNQTITNLSRIRESVNKTILNIARIQEKVNQAITGLSRITALTIKTITGKSAIQETTSQIITGISRIQEIVSKTIIAITRITSKVNKTIVGVSRISETTSQIITGLTRMIAMTSKTITGISRMIAIVNQFITGKSRIQEIINQTLTSISRIQEKVSQTISALALITATTNKIILAKADISEITIRITTGKSRIREFVTQTLTAFARIQEKINQTILGKSRITAITQHLLIGKGDIQKTIPQIILGESRIQLVEVENIIGQSRITAQTIQTITGLGDIRGTTIRDITGVAHIIKAKVNSDYVRQPFSTEGYYFADLVN